MGVYAVREDKQADWNGVDVQELRESFGLLRNDVRSIAEDVRDVLQENAALKQELERLKNTSRPAPENPAGEYSSVQQLKDELLHHLRHLEDLAVKSSRRPEPPPPPRPRPEPAVDDARAQKRMMMLMMMNELFS